jgi:hypothetical protein
VVGVVGFDSVVPDSGKVERWRAKYAALPPAERLAIMAALNEVDAG